MMKYIILSLGLLCGSAGYTQQRLTTVMFTGNDITAMLEERSGWLAEEIISLVRSGKIKAYKDSLLRKSYPLKEWEKINFQEEEYRTQIQVHDEDPYLFIDTIIYLQHQYPFFRHILARKGYVHYFPDVQRQFYLDEAELQKLLGRESARFMNVYETVYGDKMIPGSMEERGKALLRWYALKVHKLAEEQKIKAYKNDSLTGFYLPGYELERVSGSEITSQHYAGPDLSDIYDSIAISPFVPDSIKAFYVHLRLNVPTPFVFTGECISVSLQSMPGYNVALDGKITYKPLGPMYHASMAELKPQLSETELYLLQEIILYVLKGKG